MKSRLLYSVSKLVEIRYSQPDSSGSFGFPVAGVVWLVCQDHHVFSSRDSALLSNSPAKH